MGDLVGSLTKPHTVVVRWLNWGQYQLEGDQRRSPAEGVKPCPVGGATLQKHFCILFYLLLAQQNTHLKVNMQIKDKCVLVKDQI